MMDTASAIGYHINQISKGAKELNIAHCKMVAYIDLKGSRLTYSEYKSKAKQLAVPYITGQT